MGWGALGRPGKEVPEGVWSKGSAWEANSRCCLWLVSLLGVGSGDASACLFLSHDLSFSAGSTEWLELNRVPQSGDYKAWNESGPGGRRVSACWLLFMA